MAAKTSLPTDWEFVKAIDHIDFIRGQEPGSKHYNTKGHGQRFIRVGNLSGKREEAIFTDLSNLSACNKSDILMSFDGSPGIVCRGFEGIYSSGIRKIILKNTRFDRNFTYYVLQSSIVQDLIAIHADAGTTIKHAGKSIPLIRIPAPPISEQKKIAAILGSVDDAIQVTQVVIDQTRRVKQGLLQQLLTRGIGHTRFKQTEIGEIPESWEIRTLPEVAEYQNGKSFPSKDYCSSGVLLARPGNLASDGFVIWDDQHTTCLPHHYWEECSAYRVGPKEILMNLTAQSLEDQFLGRVCITPDENQCLLNQRIARITPKTIDFDYLFWALKGPHFRKHVDMIPKGSKVQHLYNGDLETAQLAIPSDLEEQKQIASMLWTVQDAVNKNENQLSNFHLVKRGLMQDLLTGRVRVNGVKLGLYTSSNQRI